MTPLLGKRAVPVIRLLLVTGCVALMALAWGQALPTLSPPALAARLAEPDPPLILDARGRAAYLEGSVPGAVDVGSDPAGFLPDSRGGETVLILAPGVDPAPWGQRLVGFGYRVHRCSTVAWPPGAPLDCQWRIQRPASRDRERSPSSSRADCAR
ncbi:hypothetical protein [uncultured Thiocystis sp.]|uniref:hypothetical protein n=1 Tax=uncultured Thiocystis sp. TaxID=1202134 RepID=UPI0025F565C9|nr:hypothetical protein [uncultured Thiocystis sp.]